MTFADMFAGIGGFRLGMEAAGCECICSCEVDKTARQMYLSNFPGVTIQGDIKTCNVPDHDILVGGFPCQPFSLAGVVKNESLGRATGFECARGTLFFELVKILKEKQPQAYIFENVPHLLAHDGGKTMAVIMRAIKETGYTFQFKVLDALEYVPQRRPRLFIVGFREPTTFNWTLEPGLRPKLENILHKSGEIEKHYVLANGINSIYTLSDAGWAYMQQYAARQASKGKGFGYRLYSPKDVAGTLLSRYHKDGSDILITQQGNPRKLTPRECARLMGFSDRYLITVPDHLAYQKFGNSVVVPLVAAIAKLVVGAINGRRLSTHPASSSAM